MVMRIVVVINLKRPEMNFSRNFLLFVLIPPCSFAFFVTRLLLFFVVCVYLFVFTCFLY